MLKIKLFVKRALRTIFWKMSAFRYIGNQFSCPVCGGHFRRMKPYTGSYYIKGELIDHYTKNAICPNCNSDIRHRFIFTFLTNSTNLLKSKIKLLHFAPEERIFNFLNRQENVEYVTCDIDPSSYPGAIKVDITDIQFADGSFDAIICSHVLEHIKNDIQAIKELYRILKPNGWALITIPIYGETTFEEPELDYKGRKKVYGIGDHMRMNGLDFGLKPSNAGFSVTIYSTDDVPGKYIDRSVNSPHVDSDKYLFFCKK